MADSREFRLEGSFVTLCWWLGLIVLAMGAFVLSSPLVDPTVPWWLAGVSGSLALGGAWCCLRIALRPAIHSLELSDEGIRVPGESKWAPWSSLSSLSERPIAQRIDILDLKGARFASLDYNVESFSDAAERIVTSLGWPIPERDIFRRPFFHSAMLCAVLAAPTLAAVGTWTWLSDCDQRVALLGAGGLGAFVAILGGAAVHDLASEPKCVTLGADELSIRYGFRTKSVPWDLIERVRLVLRTTPNRKRWLDVVVFQIGGTKLHVRPLGANAFDVFSSMRHRLSARSHRSPMQAGGR